MPRFTRPFRNTTQFTRGGNLLFSGHQTVAEPRAGRFNANTERLSDLICARVGHGDAHLSIETTRAYLKSCEDQLDRHLSLPNAQVQGRNKSFLGSARRNFWAGLGIGMGEVRVVSPEWSRPDRDAPATSLSGQTRTGSDMLADSTALRTAALRAQRMKMAREQIQGVTDMVLAEHDAIGEPCATALTNANHLQKNQAPHLTTQRSSELTQQIKKLNTLQDIVDQSKEPVEVEYMLQMKLKLTSEANKIKRLLSHPPGFELGQDNAPLRFQLKLLADYWKNKAPSISQWPTTDALEVLCNALAIISKGDQNLAATTLQKLRERGLTDLVPQPGHWFDGSRAVIGIPRPAALPLEKLVSNLVDLPCGVELLSHLVKTHDSPITSIQQDAVLVYHRAIRAANREQTADTNSLMWLRKAAFAASKIAHQGPLTPPLSVQHRAAFHGVRNGLLSIAKGGHFDEGNRRLLRLSEAPVDQPQSRSPLRTRCEAVRATAQVGLATPLEPANEDILQACSILKQTITSCLTHAHRETQNRNRGTDLQTLQPLLKATSLLSYIEEHAKEHLRLDMMTLNRRAWRSIDRQTASLELTGSQLKTAATNTKARVNQLGWPLPKSALNLVPDQKNTFSALKNKLDKIQSPKSTVLEIIHVIHESLGEVAQALADHQVKQGGRDHSTSQELNSQLQQKLALTHELLKKIDITHKTINEFLGQDNLRPTNQLAQWVMPAVEGKSGAVTMKYGHTMGINTCGLSWVIRQVTELFGFGFRLDAEASRTREQVLKYAKQSRGIELFVGDTQQNQRHFGLGGGVRMSLFSLPSEDGVSTGITANWSLSHTKTNATGVFVRSPIYGDFSLTQAKEAKENFNNILASAQNWQTMLDQDTGEKYNSPLEAILSRHPNASVSMIEQLNTDTKTNSSGVMLSVSGGGPFARGTLPSFFGSASLGIGLGSSRQRELTQYKMHAGSQAFAGTTASTKSTVNAQFRYAGHLGGKASSTSRSDPGSLQVRGSSAVLQIDLYRQQAQSTATVIRQPDGTLVGEKAQEFNTFEPFQRLVEQRWDEWIERGIQRENWDNGEPEPIKRLLVEQALKNWMKAAAQSVREAGTVTLNETLEICPDVCAELSACLALEELALARGQHEQAIAAYERRQRLLEAESSYRPYKLKAIVQSQRDTPLPFGVDLIFSWQRKKSASAVHEYDSFP